MAKLESVGVRVARGVKLLNRKAPDWQYNVLPDMLNMTSLYTCVLGQVYGHYNVGCKRLRITNAIRNGFTIGYPYSQREWDELQEAWLAYLEQF